VGDKAGRSKGTTGVGFGPDATGAGGGMGFQEIIEAVAKAFPAALGGNAGVLTAVGTATGVRCVAVTTRTSVHQSRTAKARPTTGATSLKPFRNLSNLALMASSP
jgi:hypothetical protein